MRFKILCAIMPIFGMTFTSPSMAQTIECDKFYTVTGGDTLQKIAQRAYGRGSAFQLLYDANREVIGRNPGVIGVDLKIWIPCPVGSIKEVKNPLPSITRLPTQETASIEILTASDFAPFTDEALPNGGMITEIVQRSFHEADPDLTFRIDFINDWSKHLTRLLPDAKYDIGFPWYKPDCSQLSKLGEESAFRCKYYLFSDPLYEVVVSYFSLDSKNLDPSSHADLAGRTICRPAGYFKFDLEIQELTPPNVTLLQPTTVNECFNKLVDGDVDIVTINTLTADTSIKQLQINDKVRQHQNLATIETLHVVVPKKHPRAQPLLLRANRGLAALRSAGVYRKVVENHLAPLIE